MSEELSKDTVDIIAGALESGRKIEAIKIYREATGQGLKEAKDFIDQLIPRLKEQDPERYAKLSASSGAGCASMILVAVGVGIALAFMFS